MTDRTFESNFEMQYLILTMVSEQLDDYLQKLKERCLFCCQFYLNEKKIIFSFDVITFFFFLKKMCFINTRKRYAFMYTNLSL